MQPYQTKTKLGKKKNLAQQPKGKGKMLPRVAPKLTQKVLRKTMKKGGSNGVGVGY